MVDGGGAELSGADLTVAVCRACLALLNTLVVFSVFDNMIAVTAVSLQLVWPLLLGLLPLNPPGSTSEPGRLQDL